MKNIYTKYLVLFAFLLSNVVLFAQQNLTLYNMEVIPQRIHTNPAFFPNYSKINIDVLPLYPVTYLNLSNSGFKYNDLIRRRADDSLYVDFNNMVSKLSKNNYLTTALQIDILSFGFRVKQNYFSFNATEKVNVRFRYPKGFMEFLSKGNGNLLGEDVNFNFGLDATHYREYGLGYARKLMDERLTVGARFKYLYGMENISTAKSDISLTTDPNDFSLTAKSDIKINMSGLDSSSFNTIGNNIPAYLFQRKNTGFAIDLGGQYKITEKISVNASVVDLGFIKWKDNSNMTLQSKNPEGSFTFSGVDLNDLISKDTTKDPLTELTDSLTKTFGLDTVRGTYTTRLASQIYAGGNYYFTPKTNVGLLLYGQVFDKQIHPGVALSFNQRLGRWFNYSVNYSIYNRSYTNVGLGMALNLGFIQWFLITDNILAPILPQITKNVHIHTGVSWTFGRKEDKDKDGIVDKKDKCPDVVGLKEFDGCPDKDKDHVRDAEDMCPNDSGSVELKGCPDRDKDKIIDLTDSCPDVFGSSELNGCPDTDRDKIIDKNDLCPNDSGSVELKGCPDKDGDKIKDSDDACPDKVGPESNKGCPETALNLINTNGDVLQSATVRKDGSFAFAYLPPDKQALFKLANPSDSIKPELKIVVEGVKKSVFRDSTGLYRFKAEDPKPAVVIPAKEVSVVLEAAEAEVLKKAFSNLEFNSGKEVIMAESYSSLDELAGLLNKKPTWNLKISGHTDAAGDAKINMALSKKRATAVKTYLVSKGVSADRFKVEWFGGKKPIASNKTPEGRQKNRRVEMLIFE
jgi:outer membrane protein OmpA-like peptidoglycan-associated protein